MSWSIGYDTNWNRDIGYGVPAFCDHPGCKKEIDRGLPYVCGAEPYGGSVGCGLFFCGDHSQAGDQLCKMCSIGLGGLYEPSVEHPEWIRHKLSDISWKPWRDEHPEEVKFLTDQSRR